MYHVYLLRSLSNREKTYVGFTTKSVLDRLKEHNSSMTPSTRSCVPWQIEAIVSFREKQKAESFEKYLKGGSGYAFARGIYGQI